MPFTIFLFLLSETILALFYRLLANYNYIMLQRGTFFHVDSHMYWNVLVIMLFIFMIILAIKYYLINWCIVNSSNRAHQNMIQSIVRSPCSYFDSTPSGMLLNKLSNDLGTIDNNLFYALTEGLEGQISALAAIINITQINLTFLIPASLISIVIAWFFFYSKPAYVACKQLFLQTKNLMIHYFGETINGLTQIRIYNQRINRMKDIS